MEQYSFPSWLIDIGKIAITTLLGSERGLGEAQKFQTIYVDIPPIEILKNPDHAQAIMAGGITRQLILQDGSELSITLTPPKNSAFAESLMNVIRGKSDDNIVVRTQYFSLSDESVVRTTVAGSPSVKGSFNLGGLVDVTW